MTATQVIEGISLSINKDEALVLLELLNRLNKVEQIQLFQHPAEERILFDLECELERVISETFESEYEPLLAQARENLIGKELDRQR